MLSWFSLQSVLIRGPFYCKPCLDLWTENSCQILDDTESYSNAKLYLLMNDYIVSSILSEIWRCKGHHKTWLSLLRVQKCLHVYDPDTRWSLRRCSVLQWTGIFQMSPPDPIIIRNSKHFTYVQNRLVISDSDNQSATLQCRCNKLNNVQNTVFYPEARGFVSY